MNFTDKQLAALRHARDLGGALHGRSNAGGGWYTMIEKLARDGLVTALPPHRITRKGAAELTLYEEAKLARCYRIRRRWAVQIMQARCEIFGLEAGA